MRAVIYTRISNDRTGARLGVDDQEKQCRELAAGLSLDVAALFSDNDLSAYKRAGKYSKPRPGYLAMLELLSGGGADVVLAWHTDRLHRDNTELEGYITVCGGDNGIPTRTVKDGDLDLATSGGRMVARIKGAVAQQTVEHMIEQQLSTKQRNRDAGAWPGGPRPFGYQPDGPSLKNGGKGALAQVPAEAAAIARAYETVLQIGSGEGPHTIAREWNEAGLRTPASASRGGGNHWQPGPVRGVLLRARNAGLIESGGRLYRGNWEPIVSEDTWRAARSLLTGPDRNVSPGPTPRWLLTSVLVCGVCGGTTFAVRSQGKRYRTAPAYVCTSLQYVPSAELPSGVKRYHLSREVERLDAYAEKIIAERLSRPDVAAAVAARPAADLSALGARRAGIAAELDEWAATAGITPRQLQIASAPLLAELAEVEQRITAALSGSPLAGLRDGEGPPDYWHRLKDAGEIARMRAIAAMLLRVRLLPVGKAANHASGGAGWRVGDRKPFRTDAVEILPPPDQGASSAASLSN